MNLSIALAVELVVEAAALVKDVVLMAQPTSKAPCAPLLPMHEIIDPWVEQGDARV